MRIKTAIVCSLFIIFNVLTFGQTNAGVRKRTLAGRSEGIASIEIRADSMDQVDRVVRDVFSEDGYNLKEGSR